MTGASGGHVRHHATTIWESTSPRPKPLITPRTKAIIPLHFSGHPVPVGRAVYALARRHGLRVVEDACHAFGSTIDGVKIGSSGDSVCFSFDPVKIITSIDGGCVVASSEDESSNCSTCVCSASTKIRRCAIRTSAPGTTTSSSEGYRYHLNNIMASIGVSQIKRVDEFIASRQAICDALFGGF